MSYTRYKLSISLHKERRWSGGAMVLGKLPVAGRPIALAMGAGEGCLDIFTLISPFSPLSPSLWETPDID